MKLRCLALTAFLYLTSGLAYGQGLSGKWQTNLAGAAQTAQALPAPGEESRAIVLDLAVDTDNKILGTVRQIGIADPFPIISGSLAGWRFTFTTKRTANGTTITETWNGEITDDNTLNVTRSLQRGVFTAAPRGRGGFGGIVPVDPAPRTAALRGNNILIFHRPASYTGPR